MLQAGEGEELGPKQAVHRIQKAPEGTLLEEAVQPQAEEKRPRNQAEEPLEQEDQEQEEGQEEEAVRQAEEHQRQLLLPQAEAGDAKEANNEELKGFYVQ